MPLRVDVPAELISWARERSREDVEGLSRRFPKLAAWESGDRSPTLKQLEDFANATHTPIGYFFLAAPPDEPMPLPDFRTIGDEAVRRPSPNLLDTIFHCQQRQEWYRDHAILNRYDPVAILGTLTRETSPTDVSRDLTTQLEFAVGQRGSTFDEAFRNLASAVEDLGVLVMTNGVVGNNTHRKLDPSEFRGFALVDDFAPVIFINGADTKAAQIFTLVHELAHIFLGESALDNIDVGTEINSDSERWCNQLAAELLVPRDDFTSNLRGFSTEEIERLARRFKVSTLTIIRRAYDTGSLEWDEFRLLYVAERQRILDILASRPPSTGGDFYNVQPVRASKRFTRALITSALEGRTLHRDAFQLLGVRKPSTFHELAQRVGVQ